MICEAFPTLEYTVMHGDGAGRAARLLWLIRCLRRPRRVTDLAEEANVARMTIYRDLLLLQTDDRIRVPLICEGGLWQIFDPDSESDCGL